MGGRGGGGKLIFAGKFGKFNNKMWPQFVEEKCDQLGGFRFKIHNF